MTLAKFVIDPLSLEAIQTTCIYYMSINNAIIICTGNEGISVSGGITAVEYY